MLAPVGARFVPARHTHTCTQQATVAVPATAAAACCSCVVLQSNRCQAAGAGRRPLAAAGQAGEGDGDEHACVWSCADARAKGLRQLPAKVLKVARRCNVPASSSCKLKKLLATICQPLQQQASQLANNKRGNAVVNTGSNCLATPTVNDVHDPVVARGDVGLDDGGRGASRLDLDRRPER